MKVGILGGTFDPIHIGHLIAAERVRDELKLDEVWLMPVNLPPHKPNAPKAEASHRLQMARLAATENPSLRAVDFELQRGGTSYTYDTVREIRQREPDLELFYIIGADMVMYLPKWVRIEDLVRLVTFVGLQRPGYPIRLDELPEEIREHVRLIEMPAVDLSSTQIREWRAAGRSVRYLVPEPVFRYMEENRLYEG